MKKINGHELIQLFEQFAPKSYALEGDKVGLQIGKLSNKLSNVLIALDVTEEVVDEAIEKDVQLIIAHHPLIYRPLQKIVTDTAVGRMIEKLIKHDIAVYAAHTNLDVAEGGVNDLLANALNLQQTEVLVQTLESELCKLVVYVPVDYEILLKEALGEAGAGVIGQYSNCSFTTKGTGEFVPREGANPVLGSIGKLEKVDEVRIEMVFPAALERKILSAMFKTHPYEEVAYDIYPLKNKAKPLGLGKIGIIKEMSLRDFAQHVKDSLDVPAVRVVGDLNAKIKKVAVLGGDGNKYMQTASFKGADVYVTGDMYYHVAHDAMMLGLNIVDPGHNVEKIMKQGVTNKLTNICEQKGFEIQIFPSSVHTDPFQFI